MLWEASVVAGYRLAGLDGEIGSVRDFYFDDQSWVIRYLIADTGNWLTGIHISIHSDRHVQHPIDGNTPSAFPVPAIVRDWRIHFAVFIHDVLQMSGQS